MGQCSFKHEDEVEGLDGSSPMGRKQLSMSTLY